MQQHHQDAHEEQINAAIAGQHSRRHSQDQQPNLFLLLLDLFQYAQQAHVAALSLSYIGSTSDACCGFSNEHNARMITTVANG